MNAAIKQQIGRPKADVGDPTSSRRKLPKEAFKFAKQMGIDMSGVEPEAEDIWRMLNDMSEKDPIGYESFVKDRLEEGQATTNEENVERQFRPTAGFSIHLTTAGNDGLKIREIGGTGKDLYLNVCHHEALEPAIDRAGNPVLDDRPSADGTQIPLVVGPLRDITEGSALAVDVLVHPSIIQRCELHNLYFAQFVDLAVDWVEEETDVKISRERRTGNRSFWKKCTNVYIGGRGEFAEIPVLFSVDHAVKQDKEKSERNSESSSKRPTTQPISNPGELLGELRKDQAAMDDAATNELVMENISDLAKKPIIEDLSISLGTNLKSESDDGPKKPGVKSKARAIKKGFLNSKKVAGTLYPEGSSEGTGGAKGGTLASFMSKCQVVDTSKMSQSEVDEAMADHAQPATKTKINLASNDPSTTKPELSAQQKVKIKQDRMKKLFNPALDGSIESLMGGIDGDWKVSKANTIEDANEDFLSSSFFKLAQSMPSSLDLPDSEKMTDFAKSLLGKHPPPTASGKKDIWDSEVNLGNLTMIDHQIEAISGDEGIHISLKNVPADSIAHVDLQVSGNSVLLKFLENNSFKVKCPFRIKTESIVAKMSRKKNKIDIKVFSSAS